MLYHHTFFDVVIEEGKIAAVIFHSKSGLVAVRAKVFVDSTGDGDLAVKAGAPCEFGNEEGFCQPMTTCFRICGVDLELFRKDLPMLQETYKQLQATGAITNPRENILSFIGYGEGVLHMNTTRVIQHDPTDPFAISRAEMLGRRQVAEMMTFLRTHSKAFDRSTLISMPAHIGVRESRKLKGVHILNAEELKSCKEFDDAIAFGCYMIDIHNPSGTGTQYYRFKDDEFYQIPYRCLLPKEYTNLLATGRCISATHEAHSAIRIMPICACLGEAAGIAAATAFQSGKNAHCVDVGVIQKKLNIIK